MDNETYFENAIEQFDNETIIKLFNTSTFNPAYKNNKALDVAVECCNLEAIELLLTDERVHARNQGGHFIIWAARQGFVTIVISLLKDPEIDPTFDGNSAIGTAHLNEMDEVVNLLWENKKVKNSLQNNYKHIYNELITKDTIKKMEHF
jgi:hypothetical protein